MALEKSFKQHLRFNYLFSGYFALISALVTGMLFTWVPLHAGYLAMAATIGLVAFLIDFLQLQFNRQINWIIAVMLISVASTARGLFLQRGSPGYHLAQIQFAALTFTTWFALVFLFRKHLLKKLGKAAGTTA